MTIEEMNALSEEELEEAQQNWTDEDWWLYYSKHPKKYIFQSV